MKDSERRELQKSGFLTVPFRGEYPGGVFGVVVAEQVKALGCWLEGWGFKHQHHQAAALGRGS